MKPQRIVVDAVRADAHGCIASMGLMGLPPHGWKVDSREYGSKMLKHEEFVSHFDPVDDEARQYLEKHKGTTPQDVVGE